MRLAFLFVALSTFLVTISVAAQSLTTDEQTFIQKAASGDQTEIKLSQTRLGASQYSRNQAVCASHGHGPHKVEFFTQTDCGGSWRGLA